MRKLLALAMTFTLLLSACGGREETGSAGEDTDRPQDTELTLWTYPVGGWGSGSTVSSMVSAFNREHPEIHLSVKILSYDTGDKEIEDALKRGEAPDLVMEGPERLTANWGARGLMADLSDLWESDAAGQIYPAVAAACQSPGGERYIYPVCMTTHCMAVNRDLFEAAGAWQYVDEASHTWTTEGFIASVKALREYGVERVGEIYCGGQAGDQGTRALVTNLYSGSFTDPDHTRYTFLGDENVRALELLAGLDGIVFAPECLGADSIAHFVEGETAMCFCWNVASEITETITNPDLDFDIFPLAFPTDDGQFDLQGGIWGFGVFDNGDEKRLEAAKTFIRFLTEDTNRYTQTVLSTTFWPVRDVPNIYENDELMSEYFVLREYLGDYYQVTPGWAEARTAWWNMLQSVGNGQDPAQAAADFQSAANAAAGQSG